MTIARRPPNARPRRTLAAPALAERRTVALDAHGKLRIVVVADTHSAPHPDAARLVAAHRPDLLLHAGDIGDLGVLDGLSKIAPLIAVRGNIDERVAAIPDLVSLTVVDRRTLPESVITKLVLLHIAVDGPRLRADATRLAQAEDASIVVCGHSHVPFLGRDNGFVVFNPGSVGPRRFLLPIVFGVIDVTSERVTLHHVDCETGERWVPRRSGSGATRRSGLAR